MAQAGFGKIRFKLCRKHKKRSTNVNFDFALQFFIKVNFNLNVYDSEISFSKLLIYKNIQAKENRKNGLVFRVLEINFFISTCFDDMKEIMFLQFD